MNFNVKCFKSIFKEQNIKLENKKLNIFIGQNGVGKTNVLEAIDWLDFLHNLVILKFL